MKDRNIERHEARNGMKARGKRRRNEWKKGKDVNNYKRTKKERKVE
jgi:hypothetical protein